MLRNPLLIASVAIGTYGATYATTLPSADTDSILIKSFGTLQGSTPTMDIYVQTTDGSGVWFDVANHHIVGPSTTVFTQTATNPTLAWVPAGSGQSKFIGTGLTAAVGSNTVTGLPVLSRNVQITTVVSSTNGSFIGTSTWTLYLYEASQSGGF